MRLHVFLALYELERPDEHARLDSPEALDALLSAAVAGGGFTELDRRSVKFAPQGVTAFAVVGESHVALHSWPEEGRLFVDVASCGGREGAVRALDAVRAALGPARELARDERVLEPPLP